ncbi:hypothetical protein [Peterkaempfera bronchialis]|uniref:hypothetical protein n=1 Tax=Peterkaempfera bronchialis TaxID=2126346 RepID=UPI003C2F459C
MRKRLIEQRCRQFDGMHFYPKDWQLEILARSSGVRDDLALSTVAEGIKRFRAAGADAWHPGKGASLRTYFIGRCLWIFADHFRSWSRRRERAM